jgi:hypothetical protein
VERIPDTSSKDRFEHICKVLGEMQAEHRMRGELLREACQLADCKPSDLPDRIRKMVVEQFRVEDSKRLTEENARLNLEVGALINENQTARMQAEAAVTAAEKIRMFANQAGEVVAKAELFDEKVGIGSKPSRTRIALILTDYSEKLERVLVDMREVGHRSPETTGTTGSGSIMLQGSSEPFQPLTSGNIQWTSFNGGIGRRRFNAKI